MLATPLGVVHEYDGTALTDAQNHSLSVTDS